MAKRATHTHEAAPAERVSSLRPQAKTAMGPRSYLVMMLLAILLTPTGLARAYRGEKDGWTRFWVFTGSYAALFIPVIGILALLPLIVLSIWGIVDVFTLYKLRTDSEGAPLAITPRDEQFARVFYIAFIAILILTGILLILAAILIISFIAYIQAHPSENPFNRSFDGTHSFERFRDRINTR